MNARLVICSALACGLLAGVPVPGLADVRIPPTNEFGSANRQYVFQNARRDDELNLCQVDAERGTRTKLWSRPNAVERWSPFAAYVANDGKHVILRDTSCDWGFDQVLVFLSDQGSVLRSYDLRDLLTQAAILDIQFTMDAWSYPGWFSFLHDDKLFALVVRKGITLCFDVATGEQVELTEELRTDIHALAERDIPAMLNDSSPRNREAGAGLAESLKIRALAPDLIPLLQDRSVTSSRGTSGEMSDFYGVQVAAAKALASFSPREAVPLIEAQLSNSTRAVRYELLNIMQNLDNGDYGFRTNSDFSYLLDTWHRLERSPMEDVSLFATRSVADRESAQYLYDHPQYLEHPDETVRYLAVCSLGARGDQRAIPYLRKAYADSDSTTRIWAFRGLVRYQPDDILDILHEGMKRDDRYIQLESMLELVRRGDPDASEMLANRIAGLKQHTHTRAGWGTEEMEAQSMCELIAELRLHAMEPALRDAYVNDCEDIRRPVCGALAALGDQGALLQLRRYAFKGEALVRSGSIRMLALAGDSASLPALKMALNDREPWVQKGAQDAISMLEVARSNSTTAPP